MGADSTPFDIEVRHDADAVTLALRGELDVATAQRVRQCLHDVLPETAGPVRIDLGDVTFVDSAGVSALLEVRRRVDDADRGFLMGPLSAEATHYLTTSGVLTVLAGGPPPATGGGAEATEAAGSQAREQGSSQST